MASPTKTDWLYPAALVLLSVIPLAAGAVRVIGLAGGANVTPENARFFAAPVPVVVHIVGATLFALLGPLQFSARFRRRWPTWHRFAGRLWVLSGLAVGLTGLWMTLFYPAAPDDGPLLYVMRLVFGSAMVICIVLGLATILRRDIVQHRAWMMRGYAIGMGAGTQVVVFLPFLVLGKPSVLGRSLLMSAAWFINLAVAEWILRKGSARAGQRQALSRAPLRRALEG